MSTGIYIRTKESYWKGKKHTKEYKEKMSNSLMGNTNGFKVGNIPWNKGTKGIMKPNSGSFKKGYKPSREVIEKVRRANKNRKYTPRSQEQRIKMSDCFRGEKSSLWKGGITKENLKIRAGIKFRLWREAVYARDNWTCQKCGDRSFKGKGKTIILHPHHIQNFAEYPELRFAIDNGITFCKECHWKFHKIYGKRNNTREQIEEFLCQ